MPRPDETRDKEKEKFCHEAMAHLNHLYRVALYIAKESTESKDLVQETYSRALGSYKQFTPGSNMKAWLTTILCNLCFHDRNQKKKWVSLDSVAHDEESSDCWNQVATENPGPESQMLLKELRGQIADVLKKVPEEFRLPIILVIMGDFSYEEAAEILSCPVGTIRSRIFRGRRLVYKELKEYMGIKEKNERKK